MSTQQFIALGGGSLLMRYHGSLYALLRAVFSDDFHFDPVLFRHTPRHFWQNEDNQRRFLTSIGKQFLGFDEGLGNWEVFYGLTPDKLTQNGGYVLFETYERSIPGMLRSLFSDIPWDELRFSQLPKKEYWTDMNNQRKFMHYISLKIGANEEEEQFEEMWYKVDKQLLIDNGGKVLLGLYGGSLAALLKAVFPNRTFDETKFRFSKVPKGYWDSLKNQRLFLENLLRDLKALRGGGGGGGGGEGKEKEKEEVEEVWYSLTTQLLIDRGGAVLLKKYNNSLSLMLSTLFPEVAFDPLKFSRAPQNYWHDKDNGRRFLEGLAVKSGFEPTNPDTYYTSLTPRAIIEGGGSGLLARYGNSYIALLRAVFPEVEWEQWRFPRGVAKLKAKAVSLSPSLSSSSSSSSSFYSLSPSFYKDLVQKIEKDMEVKEAKDWYRISRGQLETLGLWRAIFSAAPLSSSSSPTTTSTTSSSTSSTSSSTANSPSTSSPPSRSGKNLSGLLAALKERYPSEVWDERLLFGRRSRKA